MGNNSGYLMPCTGIIRQGESSSNEHSGVCVHPCVIADEYFKVFNYMCSEGVIDLKRLSAMLPHLKLKRGLEWNFMVTADTPRHLINRGWAWMLSSTLTEQSAWEVLLWLTSLGHLTGEWESIHLITHENCLTDLRLRSARASLDDDIITKAKRELYHVNMVMVDRTVRVSLIAWVDGAGLRRVTFVVKKVRGTFAIDVFGMVEI